MSKSTNYNYPRSFTPNLEPNAKYPHQQPIQFKQQAQLQSKTMQGYFPQNEVKKKLQEASQQFAQSQKNINHCQPHKQPFQNQSEQFRLTQQQEKSQQQERQRGVSEHVERKGNQFQGFGSNNRTNFNKSLLQNQNYVQIQQNNDYKMKQNIQGNKFEFKKNETTFSQNNQGFQEKKIHKEFLNIPKSVPVRALPQNLNQAQYQQPQNKTQQFKQSNENMQEVNQSKDRERSVSENIPFIPQTDAPQKKIIILADNKQQPQNTEQQNQNQFGSSPQKSQFNNNTQYHEANQCDQQIQDSQKNDVQKQKALIKVIAVTNIDLAVTNINRKRSVSANVPSAIQNFDAAQNNSQFQRHTVFNQQNNAHNQQQKSTNNYQQNYMIQQQNVNHGSNQQSKTNYIKPQSDFQQSQQNEYPNSKLDTKNESLTESELFQTVMTTQQYTCHYCNNIIQGQTLQLNCFHTYCVACFREQVKNVVENKMSSLQCLCGNKIKFTPLLDQKIYDEFKERYFSNQVSLLYKKYPWKFTSCSKCNFFWISQKIFRPSHLCVQCS